MYKKKKKESGTKFYLKRISITNLSSLPWFYTSRSSMVNRFYCFNFTKKHSHHVNFIFQEVNNLLLGPFQIVNQNQLGSSANVKSLSVGSFLAPSGVSKGHNVQNMIVKDAHGNVVRGKDLLLVTCWSVYMMQIFIDIYFTELHR